MKDKWISIKDELPPFYERVIAAITYVFHGSVIEDKISYSTHEVMITDVFDDGTAEWDFGNSGTRVYPDLEGTNVTHWMPWPQNPNKVLEEDDDDRIKKIVSKLCSQ